MITGRRDRCGDYGYGVDPSDYRTGGCVEGIWIEEEMVADCVGDVGYVWRGGVCVSWRLGEWGVEWIGDGVICWWVV